MLLVTDAGIYGAGLTKEFESVCAKENIDVFIYKDTVANPTVSDVEKAHTMYELNECKAIVAFGGGSAMDCAKAAGARAVNPKKPLSKMKGVLHIFRRLPLLIAVPTTAGTGSETTARRGHHRRRDSAQIPDQRFLPDSEVCASR